MEARLSKMMSKPNMEWYYIKEVKTTEGHEIFVTRDPEGRTICLVCDDAETGLKSRDCEHCKAVQSLH